MNTHGKATVSEIKPMNSPAKAHTTAIDETGTASRFTTSPYMGILWKYAVVAGSVPLVAAIETASGR